MTKKEEAQAVAKTVTEILEDKYPEHLIRYVRQALGLDEEDPKRDEQILRMSRADFLNYVAQWNGLIGYGDTIREWVGDVYGIELGENEVAFEDASEGQVRYNG